MSFGLSARKFSKQRMKSFNVGDLVYYRFSYAKRQPFADGWGIGKIVNKKPTLSGHWNYWVGETQVCDDKDDYPSDFLTYEVPLIVKILYGCE